MNSRPPLSTARFGLQLRVNGPSFKGTNMTRKRRFLRKPSVRIARPLTNRRPLMASRLGFEPLEDRQMLAGYFDSIANRVTGPAGAMANITTSLRN